MRGQDCPLLKGENKMFYLFVQNNSYGEFQYDADKGIGINVAFEANSEEEAIERAQDVIYFLRCSKRS